MVPQPAPVRAPVRLLVALCVGVLAMVGSGCTGDDQSTSDPSLPGAPTSVTAPSVTVQGGPVVFTDSAVAVVVVAGQDFSIRLPANPSTGYVWRVTEVPNQTVVDLIDTDGSYQPPQAQMPGAEGSQVFGFRAVATGTTQIVLTYERPFDPDDSPTVETFTFEVL